MRNRFIIPKEKYPELRESKKNFFMEIIKDTLLGNIFLLDMIPNIYNYCEAFIDMIRFDWFKGLAIHDLTFAKKINDIENINDITKIYNIDQIKKYMGWYCKCYRDKYGRRSKYISEICDHCMFKQKADDSYYDFEKKQVMSSSQKNNHTH